MAYQQPSAAPESCRGCANLHLLTVGNEPRDRCTKLVPMHPGCGYRVTADELRARNRLLAARDAHMIERAREVRP